LAFELVNFLIVGSLVGSELEDGRIFLNPVSPETLILQLLSFNRLCAQPYCMPLVFIAMALRYVI
jgi:hypothetical protein